MYVRYLKISWLHKVRGLLFFHAAGFQYLDVGAINTRVSTA